MTRKQRELFFLPYLVLGPGRSMPKKIDNVKTFWLGSTMLTATLRRVIKASFNALGYEIKKVPKCLPSTDIPPSVRDRLRSSPVKLHIGCGPRVLKGWVNMDVSYEHFGNYMQYYTEKFYPAAIRGDQQTSCL
jgi:hypothetical protein